MEQPLRILSVVNLPWNAKLGAVRVWVELEEQWRGAGLVIEKFSLEDAFPRGEAARAQLAFRQVWFARKAAAWVKKNAARFDIIDALIGTLPYSKKRLGFDGLLVARSVGLYRTYERFDQFAAHRWPKRPRGKIAGRIFYALINRRQAFASEATVRQADLINLPNDDELAVLRSDIGASTPAIVQPYGLTPQRRRELRAAAIPAVDRLRQKKISFIGMWTPRKGALDWPLIIERIRARVPEARFAFLGTMTETSGVQKSLAGVDLASIEFVPDYRPEDLPALLADSMVGAFPSYIEGFGLAVLEQLAAGIPTVAYDVPGPRAMLRPHLSEMLVPAGDVDAFAEAICRILLLEPGPYGTLSSRCAELAGEFSWPAIAQRTIELYRERLAAVRHS